MSKFSIRCFLLGNTDILLHDNRFQIDELYFKRRLKFRSMKRYELDTMKVGDIIYGTEKLCNVPAFKYLEGNVKDYELYCQKHREILHYQEMGVEKYNNLIKSLEEKGFNQKNLIIVDYNGCVKDGQHRSCYLLHKYGKDYQVPVLRIELKSRNIFQKMMRYIYKIRTGI